MIAAKHLVYMFSASLVLIVFLIGLYLREDHLHNRELAAAVNARQLEVNQFLRTEVCDRLKIRDDIQINYLQAAVARYEASDPGVRADPRERGAGVVADTDRLHRTAAERRTSE